LEESVLARSKMMKEQGMALDDIILAKRKVRNFKPRP
jgi:hypothetical protein